MKICSSCNQEKPLDLFYMNRGKPHARCKACTYAAQKERVAKNAEKVAAYHAEYYRKNKAHLNAYHAEYREKNADRLKQIRDSMKDWYREYNREYHEARKDEINARQREYKSANRHLAKEYRAANKERAAVTRKEWSSKNKHLLNARAAKRRFAIRNALPSWADLDKIMAIYAEAKKGENLHVDHIVPLQSDLACGLHVHHNLQVVAASENLSKGNRYWPDMP